MNKEVKNWIVFIIFGLSLFTVVFIVADLNKNEVVYEECVKVISYNSYITPVQLPEGASFLRTNYDTILNSSFGEIDIDKQSFVGDTWKLGWSARNELLTIKNWC